MLAFVALLALCALLAVAAYAGEVHSEDAAVVWDASALELRSAAMVQRFSLTDGALRRTSWVVAEGGVDLLAGQTIEDFAITCEGRRLSSADAGWGIGEPVVEKLSHGELRVALTLSREGLQVTRLWTVYPGISLVRGWLQIGNAGEDALRVDTPPVLSLQRGAAEPELLWMTGAELFGDSWRMRAEAIGEQPRVFDSYDAPPTAAAAELPGDGVDCRILLQKTGGLGSPRNVVWPNEGWAHSAHGADVQSHEVGLDVHVGDRILFVLGRHEQMTCDTTEWDPVIAYEGGESYRASEGFSTTQGQGGWYYGYLGDDGTYRDLTYADAPGRYGNRWRLDVNVIEPFVSETEMHPDPRGCAVRVFQAPRDGHVTISGTLRNSGNSALPGAGFRMGTMAYAPWLCVKDRSTGLCSYMGFDCMTHWRAEVSRGDGTASVNVALAGFSKALRPGETVRTPYSFTGVCGEDLDEMGQELLEWQYRYLWDYTREPWFPGVRMLGYWMKGTKWGSHGWVGGDPDWESTYRKVFRTADFMRYCGGDTYHRDWGWWDRAGDWNGPDFRSSGEYLRKHGMGQLIYAFIYTVDGDSSVATQHPEWLANPNTLDQSMPDVVDYEVELLDSFYRRWGRYQWRNDSTPIAPRDGDDTVMLGQQQGFMEVLRRFLDSHPDCAFQGVNGGGMALNWEYLGYASGFQFTDGQSRELANYYASYLFPPDKVNNMPDIWDPDKYDPATWRGLLTSNFDLTGDTFDEGKLEGLRTIVDIYHYLQARGVVGRWVRVYHPIISGDDETMYLQRLSWDRTRGIVITKHRIEGAVTVRPKGLLPAEIYEVSFQDSPEVMTRTGAELMAEGLKLVDPAPGELIYLNLTDHPGNRVDSTPPTPPVEVRCAVARNMGVPGVEVTWRAGADESWLSHYTVFRDGEQIDRVAKGCFYFDHSAGADPAALYEVRAVDGAGNVSAPAATPPTDTPRPVVLDDADAERIEFRGRWEREEGLGPAYRGTLSRTSEAGAGFSVYFVGRSVTWHSRLGASGGLAKVWLDDEEPAVVSCYAADEIPGWPIWQREWPKAGEHALHVEVTGQPDERSAGADVWLDGVVYRQ